MEFALRGPTQVLDNKKKSEKNKKEKPKERLQFYFGDKQCEARAYARHQAVAVLKIEARTATKGLEHGELSQEVF